MSGLLLPYQKAWVSNTDKVAVWEKSRRIGASFCDAADSVLVASKSDSMNVLYMGYNREMAQEYIQDCGTWARAYHLSASHMDEEIWEDGREEILTYVIKMASGSRIQALSSKPRSLRGRQGKVVIDEAAFADNLDELLKAAMALLIWEGTIKIISTHNGSDNPFNRLVREIRDGAWPYAIQRTTFREAVGEGLYKKICETQGRVWTQTDEDIWIREIYDIYGDSANEELDCIPRSDDDIYIPRAMVESCQDESIPIVRLARPAEFYLDPNRKRDITAWCMDVLMPVVDSLPAQQRSVLGMDFGRNNDLSVIWVMQCQGVQWRTRFLVELRAIPFDMQRLILFKILSELPLLHIAKLDGRGNGQQLAEEAQQAFGASRVESVAATEKWYSMEIPAYRAALEGRKITVPVSEDIIADHRRIVLRRNKPSIDAGTDKGADGMSRHGDSAVAGILCYSAARHEAPPPVGVTIPPRRKFQRPARTW